MDDTTPPALPPKKRPREDGALKLQKACALCRRAKLKCVVEVPGQPCARCASRNEECRFKIPLHDDKWQQSTEDRLAHLTTTMEFVVKQLGLISARLDLPFNPPAPLPVLEPLEKVQIPAPKKQNLSRASSTNSGFSPRPIASTSGTRNGQVQPSDPVLEHDYTSQSGAAELLARSHTQTSPSYLNQVYAGADDEMAATGSFFGLLDNPIPQPTIERGDRGRTTKERMRAGMGLDVQEGTIVDCVKCGLVGSAERQTLVDFFQAHLAPSLFGFPLKLGFWPFIPDVANTGITPLILASFCMIAAERMPQYHHIANRLALSDFGAAILDARPGQSFVQLSEADVQALNGAEPDLDRGLGIGPEEVAALLVYATFSCSPRSDLIARTAFEWTRGYLKNFMVDQQAPATSGKVFGLLPQRRDLSFVNWLRLWLFAFVVDAQQSLHHERPSVIFDPTYFCDTLLLNSASACTSESQQHDRSLVAHARLCALLHKIQHTRASSSWDRYTTSELISCYEKWNIDLDRWWAEQGIETGDIPTDMALALFRLFARTYLNLAASKERGLGNDPSQWRFRAASVRAAVEMLRAVQEEPFSSGLNLLLPFYVKMVWLSAMLLLSSLQQPVVVLLACNASEGFELIGKVADGLAAAPVQGTNACHAAAQALRAGIQATREIISGRLVGGM